MARLTAPPATGTPTLTVCGYTHPGRQREENEDALGLFPGERLFVVADGMGGRAAGEIAARLAIDGVEEFFRTHKDPGASPWPHPFDQRASLGANLLRVGIKVANQTIRTRAEAEVGLRRMGATLGAMAFGDTQIVVAHVGDVRVYRRRGPSLARLTRDHSLLEEVRAAHPELSGEALAVAAPRHVVTRALGSKDEVEPTVYVNTFAAGDLYLLCSDGIWDSVPETAMTTILGGTDDLEQACQQLLDAANDAGGPDNMTAILARVE